MTIQREDTITSAIGFNLNLMHPEWEIDIQQTFPGETIRPDMIVRVPSHAPVPIEAKWDNPRQDVEKQATAHLGQRYTAMLDGEEVINQIKNVLAIRYPTEWISMSTLEVWSSVQSETFKVSRVSDTGISRPMSCTLKQLAFLVKVEGGMINTIVLPETGIPDKSIVNAPVDSVNDDIFVNGVIDPNRLKNKLKMLNITLDELAKYLGLSSGGTVGHWWGGMKTGVPVKHHQKIREFFDEFQSNVLFD